MARRVIRILLGLAGAGLGFSLGFLLSRSDLIEAFIPTTGFTWYSLVGLLTLIFGFATFLLAPWFMKVTLQMVRFFEAALQRTPIQDLVGGALGLIVGLIIANLLGAPLARIPWVGPYIPVAASLLLGYLGLSVGLKKKEDLTGLFSFLRLGNKQVRSEGLKGVYKILDTNVIIDGRIADICRSGFLEGTLMVPRFVLEELQHIADSSDLLRRNKGRRGLDILNKMRKEQGIRVEIRDFEDLDDHEVDANLIKVAKRLDAPVITNDYNLNKVAELEGVKVLNINELANAVKPLYLPGEEIVTVDVIRDGKEVGQGIAYLEDGTMIVIEGGKKYIGQSISVLVTSVLQTSAGRMIFAKPKIMKKDAASSHRRYHEVKIIG
ncbi:MAG: PIN domain-containing protein [Bacillota bacterium]|nr:PIN domain-containing protein [Bacillota bacterium]